LKYKENGSTVTTKIICKSSRNPLHRNSSELITKKPTSTVGFLIFEVVWGGIEPPTQGFSVLENMV